MSQNKQEKIAVLDNALVEGDCGGADYNNQYDWKIRGIMVGSQSQYSFSISQFLGFFHAPSLFWMSLRFITEFSSAFGISFRLQVLFSLLFYLDFSMLLLNFYF